MSKDNQPTGGNNQTTKINVMSLNEPGDGYPVNSGLESDVVDNTVGVDVRKIKEVPETDTVKNYGEQNEEMGAVNLIGAGVNSSEIFRGVDISSESSKGEKFEQSKIDRESGNRTEELDMEAKEHGYLDLSSELSGHVSKEDRELPVSVNSGMLPVDTESYNQNKQLLMEQEIEGEKKTLEKDMDTELAISLKNGDMDSETKSIVESENEDVGRGVFGSDVEIGTIPVEGNVQQQSVHNNKIKEEAMNTVKPEKNVSTADDYFARKSAEMLPDKKLINFIDEIEIVNSELKDAKELHSSLAKQYSTVESETASVLGGGEPITLKKEVETTNDKVIELESKLEEQIQELEEYLKNNPNVLIGAEKELSEIMDIDGVKNVIDKVQQKEVNKKVEGNIDVESNIDVENNGKFKVEVVVNSEAGLGGAIREALSEINPKFGEGQVKEVFDNFTMGILNELSEEGMSREEAIEAYKAMVKSLEVSNGVIKVERNNSGELRAHIVNNASEQGISKTDNNMINSVAADDYDHQMAA